MSKHTPPKSRWALVLYIAAILLILAGLLSAVSQVSDNSRDGAIAAAWNVSNFLSAFLPALIVAVLGGVVQYLADIRWALIQRLDNTDA